MCNYGHLYVWYSFYIQVLSLCRTWVLCLGFQLLSIHWVCPERPDILQVQWIVVSICLWDRYSMSEVQWIVVSICLRDKDSIHWVGFKVNVFLWWRVACRTRHTHGPMASRYMTNSTNLTGEYSMQWVGFEVNVFLWWGVACRWWEAVWRWCRMLVTMQCTDPLKQQVSCSSAWCTDIILVPLPLEPWERAVALQPLPQTLVQVMSQMCLQPRSSTKVCWTSDCTVRCF